MGGIRCKVNKPNAGFKTKHCSKHMKQNALAVGVWSHPWKLWESIGAHGLIHCTWNEIHERGETPQWSQGT